MSFLPEIVLLAGALVLFVISLGQGRERTARATVVGIGMATVLACLVSLEQEAILFDGAYRVDVFSQWLKLALALGFLFVIGLSGDLPDIRADVHPEYFLFVTLSVTGLVVLVSCVDLITLIVALELSSFPLYFLVAMRREREGQRTQMESAIKYMMFGVAANGIMLFGFSYLFGLTGTTSLPLMVSRLDGVIQTPLATLGLGMLFAGAYYKLAIFPFHFWTPDVYQGGSNETSGLIASLPKVGAVAVLVRFVSLAGPEHPTLVALLTCLAVASMVYGNLIALAQKDFKRLLGFSGIAHAGYALVGFVAMDVAGFTAALYYSVAYMFMVVACFVVISRVSSDGVNVAIRDLAGLHRRSPLLAATLLVAVFALAGLPPFAGFIGKLALLKAALTKGHLTLVIVTVLNAAIAIYYYLGIIRETYFGSADERPAIRLDAATTALCGLLILAIVALGIYPNFLLSTFATALNEMQISVPALAAHF